MRLSSNSSRRVGMLECSSITADRTPRPCASSCHLTCFHTFQGPRRRHWCLHYRQLQNHLWCQHYRQHYRQHQRQHQHQNQCQHQRQRQGQKEKEEKGERKQEKGGNKEEVKADQKWTKRTAQEDLRERTGCPMSLCDQLVAHCFWQQGHV